MSDPKIGTWQTANPAELRRQLALLEKAFRDLKRRFDAYVKDHP